MIGLQDGSRRSEKRNREKSFYLHAAVVGCRPRVWRRFCVREGMWLSRLHDILQIAFDWYDYQTHSFQFDERRYGNPLRREEMIIEDDRDVTLRDVDVVGVKHFLYRYHFGEGWMVELTFGGEMEPGKGERLPVCISGERAGPPEDCGSTKAYHDMVQALAAEGTELQREWREWVGPEYAPEACDPARINKAIRKLGRV
ncbi:MAG: plasmid pRiA4b ORF-3 family protein [Opitutaceae bacterium]|nr:plasmid pRiA4b ORF-3 family protein [Opitutaceae bacterium]